MHKKFKLYLFLILLPLFFTSCQQEQKSQTAPAPIEIGFINPVKQSVSINIDLTGRVKAKNVAQIRPQIGGIIKKRVFIEGSFVEKDEVLYEIDDASYKATYDKAKAALASARANLLGSSLKLKRADELLKHDSISKQEFDDIKANHDSLAALVEQKIAELEMAKIDLQRCQIKAPISGYIGISSVTDGALVLANQSEPLAIIQDTNSVFVDLNQSYSEMLALKKILKDEEKNYIVLTLDDGTVHDEEGILETRELSVDEGSGTVTLRAEVGNKSGVLLPGMFVKATIESQSKVEAFLIPQQAVQRDQKGNPIVTIIDENSKAITKIVTTQRAIENRWLISAGIKESDKVAIEGLNRLTNKSQITLKDLNSKYEDKK